MLDPITYDINMETLNLLKTITRICHSTSLFQDMAIVDLSYKVIFYFKLRDEEPTTFIGRISHNELFRDRLLKKKPA